MVAKVKETCTAETCTYFNKNKHNLIIKVSFSRGIIRAPPVTLVWEQGSRERERSGI